MRQCDRPCLRSGEITRLRPEHFKLAEGLLRVGGEVSKVREPRNVVLQPNVAAWLKAYACVTIASAPGLSPAIVRSSGEVTIM